MPNANSPSGPGRPLNERRDAVNEQEELDEMASDGESGGAGSDDTEALRNARHAERDAHTRDDTKRNKTSDR